MAFSFFAACMALNHWDKVLRGVPTRMIGGCCSSISSRNRFDTAFYQHHVFPIQVAPPEYFLSSNMTDFTVKPTLDEQGQLIYREDYRLSCHISSGDRTYRSHAATIYK